MIVPDVVYTIVRCNVRVAGFALCAWRLRQYAHNAFDNIVNVSKIPMHLPLVVNLNGRSLMNGLAELKDRHIRSAPRPIDREETEPSYGKPVKMRINMGHQFIAFFRRGVKADRVVYIV